MEKSKALICNLLIGLFLSATGNQDCVPIPNDLIYRGAISTTKTGRKCQRWDSQQPHAHAYTDSSQFPDSTLYDAANYCRSPNNIWWLPWCYTTSMEVRWEYCDLDAIYTGNIVISLGSFSLSCVIFKHNINKPIILWNNNLEKWLIHSE